ncbi:MULTISPECIES: SMP-30/gluconolactonase/LRE family protein [Marinobacter]|uniref:SMP-30/gluconolactonase/LRE family protein n=1 Tax=Marinobacter suaedae TaxID=3057675 RepID=A0ABT8W0F7_9GAMM|nr:MULTISPECIES: SMP-30/gluconolactonase/LRE family protein [unclassified Marinobacter]MBZ2170329.1 SMP-30/gluconolactonase/LRE family protein [Marinobacter sp. F4216]MDO3721727.1 SMP-30/gluconolactonase/LRE family protein [Marinobacter sp. chi1]
MRWLMIGCLVLFAVLGGFLLAPSPIDSRAWAPPSPPPLTGPLTPNERLRLADLLARGKVYGPEDTAVNEEGVLHAGTQDGRIIRLFPDGRIETWLKTEGRPLGMVFDQNGDLIVADAWKGLLSVTPEGEITVLTREAEGTPFRFTDDVDIAPDGRIYFSDASSRFQQPDYRLDLLEMRPWGRLLRYTPRTGKTEVLLGNLHFANGVAVSPDGDFVLVNETWKYRILRYWITGPKAGQAEVFADNLPGFPDNLAVDSEGRYWVAFPTLRNSQVDALHRTPWLKDLVAKLPDSLKPKPQEYGLVVAFDRDGNMITSLHDTRGTHLQEITSVNPHEGYLYFGSLHNDRIGRLPLHAIPGLGDDA